MNAVVTAVSAIALALGLAGCEVHYQDDDSVSHRFGSDYFGAGGDLNLTESVTGDAFLAGGQVSTASDVQGDLIVAGGEVSIGGAVGDDLYAAGGELRLDAIVSGSARLAGGDVRVGPATAVTGALTLSGGRVRYEGTTQGPLHASGGDVTIDGNVHGDVEVYAEDVHIGPATRIDGKLKVRSSTAPNVPAGAQVLGGVEFEQDTSHDFDDGDDLHDVRTFAHGVGSLLWILGVFVTGVLFTLAFPSYAARSADWIGREPLRSLGLGFVMLVCLPVLAVLLLITIVGIPLALVVMMLYVLMLFLGWVTAALFLARKGLELTRRDQPVTTGWNIGALLLAVLALWLLGRVPVLGGWITFAALVLGVGALVWQGWPRRAPPPVQTGAAA